MVTAAGLLNQAMAGRETSAANRVSPMATPSSGGSGTSTADKSSAGITANDFLTLLVTEMKNQDPTANTDPNEYINQLVNVNSLQQLISINETLTGTLGNPTPSARTAQPAAQATTNSPAKGSASEANGAASRLPASATASAPAPNSPVGDSGIHAVLNNLAHGNLSVPETNPAASRVAHALDGRRSVPFVK